MSRLSIEIFDSLKTKHSVEMKPSGTHLNAANQLPTETRDLERLPVKIGGMKIEQNFHVLAKSEADCLFSKKQQRLIDDTCDALYHKVFSIQVDRVFCLVATDSILVPASHSMIIPSHIPGWKRPPIALAAVFESHERLNTENQVRADHVMFNFAEEMIPVMVTNCGDEAVMIHRKTILRQSELVEWGNPKY